MGRLGDLVVSLSANTAEFQSDLGRAARVADKRMSEMQASFNRTASIVRTGFGLAIGVTSIASMKSFVEGTLESVAALKDMSEQSGASVNSIAGLAPVIKASNSSIEIVSNGLIKLSKGMAGIDKETSGASRALGFLGISARDALGNLNDPGKVLNDISLKLYEFKDGAGKTALAIDLFGKAGASMLPFLNDLAQNQDLLNYFSGEAILKANELSEALHRQKAIHQLISQTILVSAIPVFEKLCDEFVKVISGSASLLEGVKKLETEGKLADWAEDVALAFAFVIDAIRGAVKIASTFVGMLQAAYSVTKSLSNINFLPKTKEDRDANKNIVSNAADGIANQEWKRIKDMWGNTELLTTQLSDRFRNDKLTKEARKKLGFVDKVKKEKPSLEYNSAIDDKNNNRTSFIENGIKDLQRSIDKESDVYKDRMKMIDLYQSEGLTSLRGATSDRILVQNDYLNKVKSVYDQEESILKNALSSEKLNTQDRLKIQDKLSEISEKRSKTEREISQDAEERRLKNDSLMNVDVGMRKGMQSVINDADQLGKSIENATVKAFNGMTDALVTFCKTGKLDFRSLADSIITDLIRISIQQGITKPLSTMAMSFLPSFSGAAPVSSATMAQFGASESALGSGLFGMATGGLIGRFAGVVDRPQILVGEGSMNEAVVPLPDGRTIPVTLNGMSGENASNVVVNINVETGKTSFSGEDASGLGRFVASAVQSELIRQKRNGGLLAA